MIKMTRPHAGNLTFCATGTLLLQYTSLNTILTLMKTFQNQRKIFQRGLKIQLSNVAYVSVSLKKRLWEILTPLGYNSLPCSSKHESLIELLTVLADFYLKKSRRRHVAAENYFKRGNASDKEEGNQMDIKKNSNRVRETKEKKLMGLK